METSERLIEYERLLGILDGLADAAEDEDTLAAIQDIAAFFVADGDYFASLEDDDEEEPADDTEIV